VQKAREVGFIDWNSGNSQFSIEEYEHYEQVENGDLNWIVPNKFVAFSGPASRCNEIAGYRLHTPEDYWDYYRKKGVTTVVRLNKKVYDRKRFVDGGFKHVSDGVVARVWGWFC
jgi:cell division cycle 14